ncbi:hypothetical protein D4R87_00095 [bacterium]|nr:MAG: hypothetical protein D4R87_00095 [bacterium]
MKKKKKSIYRVFSISFFLISAGLVLFVGYLTFSRATVVLTPATTTKTAVTKIVINSQQQNIDLENTIIPGTLTIHEFEKIYKDIPIMDKAISSKSTGAVTIFNKQSKNQYLLIDSQLSGAKNSVVFMTDQAITVPANGSVQMTVTAKEAGIEGNIPAQKFNFIKLSPSMQTMVYAESSDFMRGGFNQGTIFSKDDLDVAVEKNQQDFFTSIRTDILTDLGETGQTIRQELSKLDITETTSDVPMGTASPQFNLTIKGTITAILFNEQNIISIASENLRKQALEYEELITYDATSIEYENASINWDNIKADVDVKLSGSFVSQFPSSLFQKERLIGLKEEEAVNYLESFPEIQKAEIYFWPPWNDTVPGGLKSNIRMEIKNEF